jgi:hypothetical protein
MQKSLPDPWRYCNLHYIPNNRGLDIPQVAITLVYRHLSISDKQMSWEKGSLCLVSKTLFCDSGLF